MPIDASIPLQVRQPENPLEQYGRALALQNALGQQQIQQQELQAGNMKLAQAQQEQADQQKLRQAYAEAQGDLVKTKQNAIRLGVNPNTLMKIEQQVIAQAKDVAELDEKKYTNLKTRNEMIGGKLQAIMSTPPEQQAAAYSAIRADMLKQGLIGPDDAPEQFPGAEAISGMFARTRTGSQMIQMAEKLREDKIQQQQADTASAREKREQNAQDFTQKEKRREELVQKLSAAKDAAEVQSILGPMPFELAQEFAGKTPEQIRRMGMKPSEQAADDRAKATAKATADYQNQRLNISKQELQLRQQENDRKYGPLTPDQQTIANKLAHGEYDPAQLGRLPGQDKERIMAAAMNQAASEGREWTPQMYATVKDFTDPKGKSAQNLATIARIAGHIGRFEKNSKEIGFAPAYASGMTVTGIQSALREDAHAIGSEFEKLVSGGVATKEQAQAWQTALGSPSAGARQRAIDEISQLVGSQYEAMNQMYKAGTGKDIDLDKQVSPVGREWLKNKGVNVKGETSSSGGWKVVGVK